MDKAIGIDVGGSKIALALVAGDGTILTERTIPTNAADPFDQTLLRMLDILGKMTMETDTAIDQCLGIGVGCTGPLDIHEGLVLNPFTLPGWDGVNLVRSLREATACPVWLENDADAALLGEAFAGAGRGCTDLVMLTLGTGVGGAALNSGRLYRGTHSEHPEIGHIPIDPTGPECYCGTRGCLESLASGEGIGLQGQTIGLKDSQEVFERAAAGDSGAQSILNHAASALSMAVWTILHTFLPERIILGGGMIEKHSAFFLASLPETIRKATMITQSQVDVIQAELGNKAGVIGAASLVFRNHSGKD